MVRNDSLLNVVNTTNSVELIRLVKLDNSMLKHSLVAMES